MLNDTNHYALPILSITLLSVLCALKYGIVINNLLKPNS